MDGTTGNDLLAVVLVSSGRNNTDRRRACRNSWFKYVTDPSSPLDAPARARLSLRFLLAAAPGLEDEAAAHGDMLVVDAPEGYENLWRKALVALADLEASGVNYSYFMHADDDSLLRLDLLVPLLEASPRERFYWGYIWDGTGNRVTAPIRNTRNKSHMPEEQYPLDFYPPFASGCGFVLSRDLVKALLAQPLPDYRLLDPPFGIHLCGRERCILSDPVTPVHDERVRPYRGIPIFHPSTLVQHYLRPEEMRPFYQQALSDAAARTAAGPSGTIKQQQQQEEEEEGVNAGSGMTFPAVPRALGTAGGEPSSSGSGSGEGREQGGAPDAGPAAELYAQLVSMGLLRR